MQIQLLRALLKSTMKGPIEEKRVSEEARLPIKCTHATLKELAKTELITLQNSIIELTSEQRVLLAIKAIELGLDYEEACRYLGWREFENFTVLALEASGFATRKHLRFKCLDKWYEIDVLGMRRPLILAVDCKHWKHGWRESAMIKIVNTQLHRVEALATILEKLKENLGIKNWRRAELLPVILTLTEAPFRLYREVPVVPIFRFKSFIYELPEFIRSIPLWHKDCLLGDGEDDYVEH
jgi:Holliday junction resolvase-like predicted endonuclease